MITKTCTIPGCAKAHKGHGLCGTHYARWRNTGNAGTAESLRIPRPVPPCSAPDCNSLARSSGALYCEMHYARMRRNDSLEATKRWRRTGNACSVDECDAPETDRGMCGIHARRARKHGDPLVCIKPEDRKKLCGPDNPSWAADEIGYHGAHGRVASAKGRARTHRCVDCGNAARQWSYDHADPCERRSELGPYSTDPGHYVPRCVSCHKIFDLALARAS